MSRTVEISDRGSFIPPSQRPDGSWRKARRVKEGYVPQEEIPLYESKGKQWANRQNQYPVGFDPAFIKAREEAKLTASQYPIPAFVVDSKGKKKKKKNKTSENETNGEVIDKKTKVTTEKSNNSETAVEWQTVQSKNAKVTKSESVPKNIPATDPAKRLKNLKKKLREIEVIEGKIASGDVKNPDKDQIEKVNRKADVLSEIFALELSIGQ